MIGTTRFLASSGAILAATTAVHAADAIPIEPGPIEYVRVCDVFGAGYFYIPGTETCIHFNGQVRADWATKHYHDEQDDGTSAHETRYRARLEVTAKNDTQFGELESRLRFRAEQTSDQGNDELSVSEGPYDANVEVDRAVISLAGFQLGYDDDYWKRAGHDGWYVPNARFDGPYGNYDALFLEYTFSADGFAATIGAEDSSVSGEPGAPDPYAGLTYTAGGLYLAGIAYYDSSTQAGAYKGRFDYDFGDAWSGLKIGGWYAWDNGRTDYVEGQALGLTAQINLSNSLILFGGYGLYNNQFADTPNDCSGEDCETTLDNSGEQWKVGLQWEPVGNLFILPEYQVTTYDDPDEQNYGFFNLRVLRTF
jgi:Porin subfamily